MRAMLIFFTTSFLCKLYRSFSRLTMYAFLI